MLKRNIENNYLCATVMSNNKIAVVAVTKMPFFKANSVEVNVYSHPLHQK